MISLRLKATISMTTSPRRVINHSVNNVTNQITTIVGQNGSLNMLIDRLETLIIHSNEDTNTSSGGETVETTTTLPNLRKAFVDTLIGLFPSPLSKNIKMSQIVRVKSKFKLLGKFMAKAAMDSRIVSFKPKFVSIFLKGKLIIPQKISNLFYKPN